MPNGDVATLVRLLAEPARSEMCLALLGGEALSTGELARAAGIAASTASEHLAALMSAGLLSVRAQGRHRYYCLADDRVGEAVEYLTALAPPRPVRSLAEDRRRAQLRVARTCYDHLAGVVAVSLADALVRTGTLSDDGGVLHPTAGTPELCALLGIDAQPAQPNRRPLVRSCLDWTERRRHLAGRLGAAMLGHLFEVGAITRQRGSRAVRITKAGTSYLADVFGVTLPPEITPEVGGCLAP